MYYPNVTIEQIQQRVLPKIQKDGEHWIWTGGQNGAGYPHWAEGFRKRNWRVHRLMYALTRGVGLEDRDDIVIDHICNIKLCVNPKHLQMISQRENVRRNPKHNGKHLDGCYYDHEPHDDINIYKITKYGQYYRCRPCYNRRARERVKRSID